MNLITMPPLTQTLGPWIKPLPGKYSTQLSKEKELLNELIDKLPKFHFFRQRFHYSQKNWLPFYWNGFKQTTRYTYVLEDISNPDKIWDNMQGNIRREIKKASDVVHLEVTDDPNVMWDLWNLNFEHKGQEVQTNYEDFIRIDNACAEHNARKIFLAKDKHGNLHSAMYLIWDEQSAYYLIGGANPEYRTSGAASFLMYEAIKFASDKTKRFDFEGSMIESVERFFRGFGGVQTPYFEITKSNFLTQSLISAKELVG
ncbi:GNAT family N-acetyltransferase [Gracilimonas sp. BCB1]|uniref:GNAT family N-acetyltransferase n=1 Tax=Gracilimonas sp. BCB1 TaxID=3152362 RepID=UPI0032D98EC0